MKALARLLRPQQWVKNGFVLAPLFFGFELLNRDSLLHAAAAFVVFCAVSSAVYIFNDWRDIDADRAHAQKRHRPLASGAVSLPIAGLLFVVLAGIAIAIGLLSGLPTAFFVTLAVYIAVNIG
jgi:decaprenyl-phosphate phosphoribosyltransferase